jgi:hypothetical protein
MMKLTFRQWCAKVDVLLDPCGVDLDMVSNWDDAKEAWKDGNTPEEFAAVLTEGREKES